MNPKCKKDYSKVPKYGDSYGFKKRFSKPDYTKFKVGDLCYLADDFTYHKGETFKITAISGNVIFIESTTVEFNRGSVKSSCLKIHPKTININRINRYLGVK